jgi:small-conductance mechanosensitive channel
VKEIQVFSTILISPEKKRIIIPNAKVANDVIVNSSL